MHGIKLSFSVCWLLSISVPKKSANDGSTDSFSLPFLHQLGGVKISCMTVYIPDFGTDILSSQHISFPILVGKNHQDGRLFFPQ
jgi:hypothetical protein